MQVETKDKLMAVLVEEIDNLVYIVLAMILVVLTAWLKPEGPVMVMISGLFGVLIVKIRGSNIVSALKTKNQDDKKT